jgi:hypothetical protein
VPAADYQRVLAEVGAVRAPELERFVRFLDAACAWEGIGGDDIVGVADTFDGFIVVHRQAIVVVTERGVFNKRIDVKRQCSIDAIANLATSTEGFKPPDLVLNATDSQGKRVFSARWSVSLIDERDAARARDECKRLFDVIAAAMDRRGAPELPSVATATSKADALRQWAAGVVRAAGVPVTDELVDEHANMAAGGIRFMVFLRVGAERGIDDLNDFYPGGAMPDGTPLDTFDDLYAHVVAMIGDSATIDREIDGVLVGAWTEFVNGCREHHA